MKRVTLADLPANKHLLGVPADTAAFRQLHHHEASPTAVKELHYTCTSMTDIDYGLQRSARWRCMYQNLFMENKA
jgi:hypothetical protein